MFSLKPLYVNELRLRSTFKQILQRSITLGQFDRQNV